MRFLRKVQAGMPYGCGYDGQLEKTHKRHGVYPLHGMRQKLSEESPMRAAADRSWRVFKKIQPK